MSWESALESEGRLGQDGNAHAAPIPYSLEKEDLRGEMSRRESVGVGGGADGVDSGEHSKELPLQLKMTCAGSVLATGAMAEALESDMSRRRVWIGTTMVVVGGEMVVDRGEGESRGEMKIKENSRCSKGR